METQLADGRDELAAECAKLDHMERRLVGSNAQRQRELDKLRADARKTESGAARLGEYHEQLRVSMHDQRGTATKFRNFAQREAATRATELRHRRTLADARRAEREAAEEAARLARQPPKTPKGPSAPAARDFFAGQQSLVAALEQRRANLGSKLSTMGGGAFAPEDVAEVVQARGRPSCLLPHLPALPSLTPHLLSYISHPTTFLPAQRYASVRESERVLRAQQEEADALLEERQGELREAEKRLAELEHGQVTGCHSGTATTATSTHPAPPPPSAEMDCGAARVQARQRRPARHAHRHRRRRASRRRRRPRGGRRQRRGGGGVVGRAAGGSAEEDA